MNQISIRVFSLILVFLFLLGVSGCNKQTQTSTGSSESAGSLIYEIHSVEDLAHERELDLEIIGQLVSPGDYTVVSDEYARVAIADYTVLEVLKGDPAFEGQTITVEEIFTSATDYTTTPCCASLGTQQVILCIFYNERTNEMHVDSRTEFIPIGEDGSVSFYSAWPDAGDYKTLDDFRALFDESDRVASAENTAVPAESTPTALSSAELETFEKWLNEPENNGFLLSSYDFISDADLDAVLAAAQDLPYGEADETQKSIYEAVTGTDASTLRVLKDSDLALYLQMKTGCDSSVFSNFSWLYMASYDAWFAPETSPAFTPVHCTGGTVLDDEYCITYEPTGEVSADFTSGTITLYPFEDGWRVLANQYADASGSLN